MAGNIVITGNLTCTPGDLAMVSAALPEHIRLTMAEPGCISFVIVPAPEAPCRFEIAERFVSRAAFDAHSARTKASEWWKLTAHIPREIQLIEE
ncbi:MAG: antibiotic biosynthesis monooxygenase [Marinosulfonomonas sp.]|nr:antibiotic biosynthesis monooxygenase [Marinosulfonomonas sp.]